MAGYKCPFCDEFMSISQMTRAVRRFNFYNDDLAPGTNSSHLEVTLMQCPNDECRKISVFAQGVNGFIDEEYVSIYPRAVFEIFPDYVPEAIRSDYEEACTILELSPKAAATLARRCLQGMIHDFWGIHGKNLNAEITMLKDHVPASQWKAIDAVRSVGNIGAHMEHDVNLIVDIDSSEAQKLIMLIEHLIEKWYIDRHDAEELYAELVSISEDKAESRKK